MHACTSGSLSSIETRCCHHLCHTTHPLVATEAKTHEIELVTKAKTQRFKCDNEFELNSWLHIIRKHAYLD